MNIKSRVLKLEQGLKSTELVVIAVKDSETNEQAYQRYFTDAKKPKMVIYCSELDVRL